MTLQKEIEKNEISLIQISVISRTKIGKSFILFYIFKHFNFYIQFHSLFMR